MANKKPAASPDKDGQKPPEQEALERRVEAMMNPRLPEAPAGAAESAELAAEEPVPEDGAAPLDIFAGLKSAPEVPKDLLKIIGDKSANKDKASTDAKPVDQKPKAEPVPAPLPVEPTTEEKTKADTHQRSHNPRLVAGFEAAQLLAISDRRGRVRHGKVGDNHVEKKNRRSRQEHHQDRKDGHSLKKGAIAAQFV